LNNHDMPSISSSLFLLSYSSPHVIASKTFVTFSILFYFYNVLQYQNQKHCLAGFIFNSNLGALL